MQENPSLKLSRHLDPEPTWDQPDKLTNLNPNQYGERKPNALALAAALGSLWHHSCSAKFTLHHLVLSTPAARRDIADVE
jgi:hypothetical protein